ncbi:ferredoxin--NADP reductase [Nocardia stercoris]|uniref:3-ketosteroid-9-alpha-monooxygenase, ferredoxin reductase component n=1 Tax=Nocardia stercoris TaxID=2483361 RepID=A0A3M2L380_9NOCA|nr:ferredoxin--NADP reductase [Nocardia stercoris]RMI30973.1 ferredoxin--NADP reductase [Nocardia stercoris]
MTTVDPVVPHTSRSAVLRVQQVIAETADACSLVFDVPEELAERFSYLPGQFLTLRIPSDRTGSVARCYSLASSPHTGEAPKVTVKRTVDGYASNWVCDNVHAGDRIEVLPPSGLFTPKDLNADLLLFAAGSGVTPIMSILKSALIRGTGQVVVIYANRDPESVIFATELAELTAAHPDRLTILPWLESERGGFPDAAALAELAGPYTEYQSFMCGPGPFMDVVHAALAQLSVPRERIHAEVFNSLSGDPFAEHEIVEVTAEEAADAATVEVELDGEVHTMSWPRSRTLVDIMLDKGLDVPYSCQEGECGSCACTVLSGKVEMDHCEILDEQDIANGYILGCQAHPVTDEVKIQF